MVLNNLQIAVLPLVARNDFFNKPYNNRSWLIVTLFAIAAIFVVMSVLITAQDGQDIPDYKIRVVDFYPQGVVDRPTNIMVKFSNDLMPDDSLDKVTTNIPFEIEPPIFLWLPGGAW